MAGTGFLSGNIFGIALRQTTATQETLTTAGLPRSFQIQHFIVGAFAIAAGTTIQIWRVRGGVATDLTPGGGALALGGAAYLNNAIGAVVIPVANNTANATFDSCLEPLPYRRNLAPTLSRVPPYRQRL